MPYPDFLIDAALSRRLLVLQGEDPGLVAALSDEELIPTCKEAGARVKAAIADVGYRGQALAENEEGDCGSRLPIARLVDGVCLWMDPRLYAVLAFDFGLQKGLHGQALGALVAQFQAFALENEVAGDYGKVACNPHNGEVAIDLSTVRRTVDFHLPAKRPAMA